MLGRVGSKRDDLDSFHLEVAMRDRVVAAVDADCRSQGLARVPPESLIPFGRWFGGEEEPGVRRFLVSPASEQWTSILPSATDWERAWCSRIAGALDCRAAYLMLHDADVFTLHLFDGERLVGEYLSSTDYFDIAPHDAGDLGLDLDVVAAYCAREVSRAELLAALAPPGTIDVNGRLAFTRTATLLGLPRRARASYRVAMASDGLSARRAFADHLHLAYREDEAEADGAERAASIPAPGDTATVLPFPSRR